MRPHRSLASLLAFCTLVAPLSSQTPPPENFAPGAKSCGKENGGPVKPCRECQDGKASDAQAVGTDLYGPETETPETSSTCPIDTPTSLVGLNDGGVITATSDVSVPHAHGSLPLELTRHYRSRDLVANADHMGHGRSFTHTYSWRMWAQNGTERVILMPEGHALTFAQGGSTTFEGQSAVRYMPNKGFGERLYQVGDFWHLAMVGGFRHTFERVTNPDSTVSYAPRYSRDSQGNTHTYTTDSKHRIIRSTDALGNFIDLTYSDIEITRRKSVVLHTITAAPVVGWNEATVTVPQSFRWLQSVSAPTNYFRLSEVQFHKEGATPGTTVKITGTPYGTGPAANNGTNTFDKAFDNNNTTEFVFSRPNNGVAGLDLGAGNETTVVKVRYYVRSTHSANLAAFIGHDFFGCLETPQIVNVLTQVTTSTGKSISYNYGIHEDTSIGQSHLILDSVSYDNGDQASFEWVTSQQGSSPSIERMIEPRKGGSTPDLSFVYFPSHLAVKGQPWRIKDGASNNTLFTSDPMNTHTFTAADGGVSTVVNTAANYYWPSSSTDAVGKVTNYTWNNNGYITSRTTPAGTTTYVPTSQGVTTSITQANGLTESFTYTADGLNRLLSRSESAAGQTTRTTTYTRDSATGRITKITYPDGSYEDYVYDTLGLLTSVREKNGSYTIHTYSDSTYVAGAGLRLSTSHGRASATATTGGETSTFEWYGPADPDGSARMLKSVTDPRGRTTEYAYDDAGRVTKTTYPDSSYRMALYDSFGNKTIESAENSFEEWTYDNYRRVLTHSTNRFISVSPFSITLGTTTYDYGLQGNACSCYGAGSPTLITSPAGRKTRRHYDLKGRLLYETVGFMSPTDVPATTTYTRDTLGRVISMTDPDGFITTSTYDSMSRVLTTTLDPSGLNLTTSFTYSKFGERLSTTAPGGRVSSATYDVMGRTISQTAPGSLITRQRYHLSGTVAETRRYSTTSAASSDGVNSTGTTFTLASSTTGVVATTYGYNNLDRLTLVTHPDSTTVSTTYHPGGETATRTDELGHTTSSDTALVEWEDSLQQATLDPDDKWTTFKSTVTDALGKTSVSYSTPMASSAGATRKSETPEGRVSESYFDAEGRTYLTKTGLVTPTSSLTADVSITRLRHNEDGLVLETRSYSDASAANSDGLNSTGTAFNIDLAITPNAGVHDTVFTYDDLNRRKSTKDPLNRTTTQVYNKRGLVLETELPDNRKHINTYDSLGRLTTSKDPKNQTLTYTYWYETGNMLSLQDARSYTTNWTYNTRGQLLSKTYPNGDNHSYTYDTLARLATATTPKGDICTYTYDTRDRLLTENWNTSTPDTTRTYFANGLLESVDNTVSTSDYLYNDRNQLTSETQTLAGSAARTVSYDYDDDGLRTDLTYPSTRAIELAWTARAQLFTVSAGGPPPLATYAHDKASRLETITHENGIVETKTYDAASQLLSNTHKLGTTTVSGHGYTYGVTGRRDTETFSGPSPSASRSYGYDNADQVTSATYGSGLSDSYDYDPAGNRSTATLAAFSSTSLTYTANNANQYTSITSWPTPTYDANGNLLTQNGNTYTWDSHNRLLSVGPTTATVGAKALAYQYDGQHRRVLRTISEYTTSGWTPTEQTHFLYDGWNVIEEESNTGTSSTFTLTRVLTWGLDLSGSLQGAGGVGGLLMAEEITSTTVTAFHFHYDGNGNVTEITNDTGSPAASYRYDAYGNTLTASGSYATTNRYRFSTKPLDQEVQNAPLYYYGYRYYDPITSRWPSRDPIGERGGVNLYGMVGNMVVNYVDVLGFGANNNAAPKVHSPKKSNITKATEQSGGLVKDQAGATCCPNEIQIITIYTIKKFTKDHYVGHVFIQFPEGDAYGQYPHNDAFVADQIHGPGEIKDDNRQVQFCKDNPDRCKIHMIEACPASIKKLRESVNEDIEDDPVYGIGPGGCPNCKEWVNSTLRKNGFKPPSSGWVP